MEAFLNEIIESNTVWLLQADDGLFAMLEGENKVSYLPVWPNEKAAAVSILDEWNGYQTVGMDLKEFITWLNELQEDEMWVGLTTETDGRILPFEAAQLQKIILELRKK
ncbi:MAG: DUF2750 domain-containing protein [Bacteroidetes bacterium]|jgi:hypothetical protein|nr:DUF2750 domain-containing protein [Bacteroidota bacterium]